MSDAERLQKLRSDVAVMLEEGLLKLEAAFKKGDKAALLRTINMCLAVKMEVPKWACVAFLDAFHSHPRTWDDVFGPPVQKGAQQAKLRKYKSLGPPLVSYARDLMAQGEPCDERLMEPVGKKFNVSGSTARRIFDATEDAVVWKYEKDRQMLAELGPEPADADIEAWNLRNELRLRESLLNFSKIPKKLRSGRSARKQQTSQKSAKD
jgi:hypothetical protein